MIKINDFNLTRNFNFTELPCLRYTWSHHYRSGGVEKRRNETEKVRERETKRHSSWRTVSSIHRARDTRCEIRGFSRYVCLYGAIIKMTSRKRKVTRRAIKENRKLKTRETVIDLSPPLHKGGGYIFLTRLHRKFWKIVNLFFNFPAPLRPFIFSFPLRCAEWIFILNRWQIARMLSFTGHGEPRLAKSVYLFRRRQISGVNLCGILGDRGKWWMMGLMEKRGVESVCERGCIYRVSRREKELDGYSNSLNQVKSRWFYLVHNC